MTKYIVTAVDYGETCNGKATVLAAFNTEAEAKEYVKNDIDAWYSKNLDEGVSVDYDKMSARFDYNSSAGCEWNIEAMEMK